MEADNMLIELHQKSPNMAISQGPIFYVEIRLLKEILIANSVQH